jgi:hypothetical protein
LERTAVGLDGNVQSINLSVDQGNGDYMSDSYIQSQMDCPIIFRTLPENVYKLTLDDGSIWLRSEKYYQDIEDTVRRDPSEGINGAKTLFPLHFKPPNAHQTSIEGTGKIGQAIVPHYIMSLHGTSITERERERFGGHTVGIRNLVALMFDVVYSVSKKISISSYRYGQVDYKYTSLMQSHSVYGSAISLSGEPPVYLKSINTDVLRKDPVLPFIEQDEWRIVVITGGSGGYLNNDPMEPLKINVDPDHFYEYSTPNH